MYPGRYTHSFVSAAVTTLLLSSSGLTCPHKLPIKSIFNGKKAGIAGWPGMVDTSGFQELAPYMSHYIDYFPNTPDAHGVIGIGMLWGAGDSACSNVTPERLSAFEDLIDAGTVPAVMLGFNEPDCDCDASSQMSLSTAITSWNDLLAPLGKNGTMLSSPSMCKQYDEDFLTPFSAQIDGTWDVTSIHVYKPTLDEAKKDVEYFVDTYGKPVWVTEFGCVYDQDGFNACTDQGEIDGFIQDVVDYFESNDYVIGYAPMMNGAVLGDTWPLVDNDGALTVTGKTYLAAIE